MTFYMFAIQRGIITLIHVTTTFLGQKYSLSYEGNSVVLYIEHIMQSYVILFRKVIKMNLCTLKLYISYPTLDTNMAL
jgi:hypothetical protein